MRLEAFKAMVKYMSIWDDVEATESSYFSKFIDDVLTTSPSKIGFYLTYKFGSWFYEKVNGLGTLRCILYSPFTTGHSKTRICNCGVL